MKVEKRDGTIENFHFEKIENVIKKVFNNKPISTEVPEKFVEDVKIYFDTLIQKQDAKNKDYAMPIEEIQDTIRDFLVKKKYIKEAEAFIIVRKKREEARERQSWLVKEITKKIKGTSIENQNANVDEESFGGKSGEMTRIVTKDYALKHIVSKNARNNHNGNMIYIHDLDSYAVGAHNCLSFPFDHVLKNGFNTRQTDVRPANSVNTASQLVAVLFQLQSLQQFGGVSATHIDWSMVPYIRKSFEKHYLYEYIKTLESFYKLDLQKISNKELSNYVNDCVNKFFEDNPSLTHDSFRYDNEAELDNMLFQKSMFETRKEIYQAVEGMYHNLNTLQSRSGNQLPFTSINYGTCTELEGRMFTKALLEVSIEGIGKFGRTSIFPCGIFQYNKKINGTVGSANYDLYRLALESSTKRLYPNYANTDWSAQKKWKQYDIDVKEKVLNELTEEERNILEERLRLNHELAEKLTLKIIE